MKLQQLLNSMSNQIHPTNIQQVLKKTTALKDPQKLQRLQSFKPEPDLKRHQLTGSKNQEQQGQEELPKCFQMILNEEKDSSNNPLKKLKEQNKKKNKQQLSIQNTTNTLFSQTMRTQSKVKVDTNIETYKQEKFDLKQFNYLIDKKCQIQMSKELKQRIKLLNDMFKEKYQQIKEVEKFQEQIDQLQKVAKDFERTCSKLPLYDKDDKGKHQIKEQEQKLQNQLQKQKKSIESIYKKFKERMEIQKEVEQDLQYFINLERMLELRKSEIQKQDIEQFKSIINNLQDILKKFSDQNTSSKIIRSQLMQIAKKLFNFLMFTTNTKIKSDSSNQIKDKIDKLRSSIKEIDRIIFKNQSQAKKKAENLFTQMLGDALGENKQVAEIIHSCKKKETKNTSSQKLFSYKLGGQYKKKISQTSEDFMAELNKLVSDKKIKPYTKYYAEQFYHSLYKALQEYIQACQQYKQNKQVTVKLKDRNQGLGQKILQTGLQNVGKIFQLLPMLAPLSKFAQQGKQIYKSIDEQKISSQMNVMEELLNNYEDPIAIAQDIQKGIKYLINQKYKIKQIQQRSSPLYQTTTDCINLAKGDIKANLINKATQVGQQLSKAKGLNTKAIKQFAQQDVGYFLKYIIMQQQQLIENQELEAENYIHQWIKMAFQLIHEDIKVYQEKKKSLTYLKEQNDEKQQRVKEQQQKLNKPSKSNLKAKFKPMKNQMFPRIARVMDLTRYPGYWKNSDILTVCKQQCCQIY